MPRQALEQLTESMFYVLMALYRGEKCGTDIAAWIEIQSSGRCRLGPATLYTILAKFEKEKFIRETKVEGRKRTYAITDLGRRAYQEEIQRLRQCLEDASKAHPGTAEVQWEVSPVSPLPQP